MSVLPPRPPGAADIVTLLGIVLACAMAVRLGGGGQLVDAWALAVGLALGWALVLGVPAVAFVLEGGRATPGWVVMLGGLAGSLPLLLLGASGVAGLTMRSNWDRAMAALENGMPIPVAGMTAWPRFIRLESQAVLFGACCGLIWWLFVGRARAGTRAANVLWAACALGGLVLASALLA